MWIEGILIWWAMTTPAYPDLIARIDGLNTVIAAPLTEDKQQAVIEGMWKRELNDFIASAQRSADKPENWPLRTFFYPRPHQNMALFHLLTEHGALRAGDFTALHGSLLSALQPNTYALAKEWQGYMTCVGVGAKNSPDCMGY
jgi:hypothetical protein